MNKSEDVRQYLSTVSARMKREMPRIQKEIKVYEAHLREGLLKPNPEHNPLFNG